MTGAVKRLTAAAGHPGWWLCPTPDNAGRLELTRADVAVLAAGCDDPEALAHWCTVAAAIDTHPTPTGATA